MELSMKNIDSFDGFETRALFSTELTCVPPLWNHRKTVGVAQAILPVGFSETCEPLVEPVSGLVCAAGEGFLKHGDFCEVTFVGVIS
jgi:hypothetical protein